MNVFFSGQSSVALVTNLLETRCWHQIRNQQKFTKISDDDDKHENIVFEILQKLLPNCILSYIRKKICIH